MKKVIEINGDIIQLAKDGNFDVMVHGCNCFNTMSSGLAKQVKDNFPTAYTVDQKTISGDINKLGNYTEVRLNVVHTNNGFSLLNCYTQYRYGSNHADGDKMPVDYEAITLCMRKINHKFNGKTIGMPKIGAGLAGGDWNIIRKIIEKELYNMNVVIVNYKK